MEDKKLVVLDGGKKEPSCSESKLDDLLSVGVWILIPYGFQRQEFCVLEKMGDRVLLGKKSWLVSSAIWFSIAELEKENGTVLGKGRYRWWRMALPFIKDVIFPFSRHR